MAGDAQNGRVHLAQLRLRDFRNYAKLDAVFQPGFHVFLGDNAQGKTNLLEAIYLMATLRSFRGVGGAQMIRHGARGYFVGATVVGVQESTIKAYWSLKERKLSVNEQPVRKMSAYLGVFRAVVFCSEDLALVKGPAAGRRRFLDLVLSQTQPGYLGVLLRYTRALRARNALLKATRLDEASLEAFTKEMVEAGEAVLRARREVLPILTPLIASAFRKIAREVDEVTVRYRSSVAESFSVELGQSRTRERATRYTVVGPHRDDLELRVNGELASLYGSEGQKRSLAIALKMAQAEHGSSVSGSPPVLLIDDVMGELDARRRAGVIPLLNSVHHAGGQVFMTCTERNWPQELGRELTCWRVQHGALSQGE